MKTLIVCLDGLEYEYILKWGLKGLIQKSFGKHDVSMIEKLYTPLAWSAFLTGRNPKEFGYTMEYIKQQRSRYADKGYPSFIRRLFLLRKKLFPKKDIGFRKLMRKIGLFDIKKSIANINLNKDIKIYTIISKLENEGYRVYSEEFPSFNEVYENELFFRSAHMKLINKNLSKRQRIVKDSWKIVAKRWRRAIEALPDHDLILFYSPFPDFAHHVFYRSDELVDVKQYYTILQDLTFLRDLKNMAILIVSDHGFIQEEHTHSDYGFWSSNIDLISKPKTILDFHNIILNLVQESARAPMRNA